MSRLVSRKMLVALAVFVCAIFGAGFLSGSSDAKAHPLGNFTISTHSGIELFADSVRIHYIVDMAEIPTFQELEQIDADGDGTVSPSEAETYLDRVAPDLIAGLTLAADGERVELATLDRELALLPGEGGLQTLRIDLLLDAAAPTDDAALSFSDTNFADRLGWREVVVRAAPGVPLLATSAPSESPSFELTAYPADEASESVRVTSADFSYTTGVGSSAPAAVIEDTEVADAPFNGFADLIEGRDLTLPAILLLVLVAMGFGAVHALEPGHGKTIVAAYFVGANGRAVHAALLGLIVAVTHSVGILVIGAVTLYGTRFILPEDLYPWLTLVSGVMVMALGVTLLASRFARLHGLRSMVSGHFILHRHAPGDHHDHEHDHDHPHDHDHDHTPSSSQPPWRSLVALGLVDGLIPTPSTLVVLLSAVALGRLALGLALIVAFSVGLALVLSGISLATILLRGLFIRLGRGRAESSRVMAAAGRLSVAVPAIAAIVLIGSGAIVVAKASAETLLG